MDQTRYARDRDPATRTAGAWERAALELESWINDEYVDPYVTAAMQRRVADLRRFAAEAD